MKKIIIVNNNFETGGVQISLNNLLKELHDKFDITILVFSKQGAGIESVPKDVKIISVKSPYKYLGSSQNDMKGKPIKYLFRAIWASLCRIFGRAFVIKLMGIFQRKITGYDIAISYLHEASPKVFYGGCNSFVLKHISAPQKITWLHGDFTLCGANNKYSEKIYRRFDKIVACSDGTKAAFIKCMPHLAEKCFAVRNCNDYKSIRSLSQPAVIYDKDHFNIITVARLSAEKGIDRALNAIRYCSDKGYKIKYHIVGYGTEEPKLKALTEELGLVSNVVFYGKQTNPYKYIANADLFLLTSYHEAAPMVFDESLSLGVPVFATETTSTTEMILERQGGYVCKNDQKSINKTLLDILQNTNDIGEISNKLRSIKFSNDEITENLANILN